MQYYSYQPDDIDRVFGLANKTVWASDPRNFNDLWDLKPEIEDLSCDNQLRDESKIKAALRILLDEESYSHWLYTPRLQEITENWLESDEHARNYLIPEIKNRLLSFGISCLSSHQDSSLMWAYYASSHAGFLIEYSIGQMDLVENTGVYGIDCQYSKSIDPMCFTEMLFNPYQSLLRALGTKSIEWAHESEYRIIHVNNKGTHVKIEHGLDISALTVGRRSSQNLIKTLKKKATELEIPCYRWEDSGLRSKLVEL